MKISFKDVDFSMINFLKVFFALSQNQSNDHATLWQIWLTI